MKQNDPHIKSLLDDIETSIDDWILTYAPDFADMNAVKVAWKRIQENGGTLAYMTNLRDRVHEARKP